MARKRAIFSRTYPRRSLRRGILAEIRRLAAQMAEDNPTWGYTASNARCGIASVGRRSLVS
jgi:hypothetical protein